MYVFQLSLVPGNCYIMYTINYSLKPTIMLVREEGILHVDDLDLLLVLYYCHG